MLFTVCTPTFNRAHTLERVFESLVTQTLRDFEWLVIDDGSNDNTEALIHSLASIADFQIRYSYQENQGKHIAVNNGALLAQGEYFLIADSDDSFPANALEQMAQAFDTIPSKVRAEFTGVTGLCADENGTVVGDKFPSDIFDSTPMEVIYKHRVKGEKWGFHKTEIMRKFPFPEPIGVKFYPEGPTWSEIGRHYKSRYINKIVRCYRQDAGSQLTKQSVRLISPSRLAYVQILNLDNDYLLNAPDLFFRLAIQGVRYSLHQSDGLLLQLNRLTKVRVKCIWIVAFPIGLFLFLLDRIMLNQST